MRSRIVFIASAICVASLLGFGVLAQRNAPDRVIKRDGHRVIGQLESFDGTSVVINGQSIPRDQIVWIGLSAAIASPPAVKNPATDEVHARRGSVESGRLVGISLSKVVTEKRSYDRTQVSWIHLAPPPGGGASRPAPPPGGGTRRPGTTGPGTGNKKSLPPWFDVKDCSHKGKVEVCFFGGNGPQSCDVSVCLCGLYPISKIFNEACTDGLRNSFAPGLSICCDKFEKGQRTHQPCDPTNDVDCDGVPNDKDRYPFDPNRSSSADAPPTQTPPETGPTSSSTSGLSPSSSRNQANNTGTSSKVSRKLKLRPTQAWDLALRSR